MHCQRKASTPTHMKAWVWLVKIYIPDILTNNNLRSDLNWSNLTKNGWTCVRNCYYFWMSIRNISTKHRFCKYSRSKEDKASYKTLCKYICTLFVWTFAQHGANQFNFSLWRLNPSRLESLNIQVCEPILQVYLCLLQCVKSLSRSKGENIFLYFPDPLWIVKLVCM